MDKEQVGGANPAEEGLNPSGSETFQKGEGQTSGQEKPSVAELLKDPEASEIISKLVEEGVKREFQSNKDKRLDQVDKNATRLDKIEELMVGKGMDFSQAKATVLKEEKDLEIETKLNQLLENKPMETADTSDNWADRETAILGARNISPQDPEIVRFRRQFKTPEEYVEALPNRLWQLQTGITGGEGDASGGQGTPVVEDLEAEYQERLSKIPRGAVHQMNDLKAEYRKKGLNKW